MVQVYHDTSEIPAHTYGHDAWRDGLVDIRNGRPVDVEELRRTIHNALPPHIPQKVGGAALKG